MRRISLTILVVLTVSTVTTGPAQAAPTIEVDPAVSPVGTIVEVKGAGFGAGEVGIHVDEVDPDDQLALTDVERDGTFVVRFEVPSLKLGAHLVLACRDVQRSGECRELAETPLEVIATPTTTQPPTTTTTTRPTTTTTAPRTTTTTSPRTTTTTSPRTTTTSPPTTTTPPRPTTTAPQRTTTTSPRTTTPPTAVVTTTPAVAVSTTTSPAAVFGTTTTAVADLAGPSTTLGGDVVPPPQPVTDLAVTTTTADGAYATPDEVGDVDITVTAIEVTQGLQNLANEFPLVAGRPTAVRLFGTSSAGYEGAVSGWLEVSRGGITFPPVPAENNPAQFTNVPIRSDNDFAPYFLVNPTWLGPGEVTFRGVVFAGDPSLANDTNSADNDIEVTLDFHEAQQVRVHMYPLHLTDDGTSGGGTPTIHTAEDGWINQTQAMKRLWPGADIVFDPFHPVIGDENSGWDLTEDGSLRDPFPLLSLIHFAEFGPSADYDLVMGMVSPDTPTEFGGGADRPGTVSWTKMLDTWSGDWPWHHRSGGVMVHEIAHNVGLKHAPCAYAPGDPLPGELQGGAIDGNYPQSYSWPDCSIAPEDPEGFYGFDVQYYYSPTDEPSIMTNDSQSAAPLSAVPFMGYAAPGKWLDPWHGCQLLDWLGVPCDPFDLVDIDAGTPGQGQGAPSPASGGVPVWTCDSWNGPFSDDDGLCDLMPAQPFDPVALDGADTDIVVLGEIDPVLGTATVSPAYETLDVVFHTITWEPPPTTTASAPEIEPMGWDNVVNETWEDRTDPALRDFDGEDYFLVLLDADSKVLGAQSIDVTSTVEAAPNEDNPLRQGPQEQNVTNFAVALPRLAGLDRIVIVNESGIIAELAPGDAAPAIASFDVEMDGDVASMTWDASDADGDPLSAIVRFGPEGARRILATTESRDGGGSATIDLSTVPGGEPGHVELIVTDGLHQTSALSDEIELPDRAPHVMLLSPAEGSTLSAGRLVLLEGMAIDAEDGPDVMIEWSSDLDGELGTESTLGTHDLRPGRHVITMTATDRSGNTVTEARAITVTEAAPGAADQAAGVADYFANGPVVPDDGRSRLALAGIIAALIASLSLAGYLLADRLRTPGPAA